MSSEYNENESRDNCVSELGQVCGAEGGMSESLE
jgi:hypothetical protein